VDGRFLATVDLRKRPASQLNAKAYRNATIARDRGRLGGDTTIRTNGGKLLFSVQTLDDAQLVHEWLQLFETNWGNSNL
jgi:hypothetical protein